MLSPLPPEPGCVFLLGEGAGEPGGAAEVMKNTGEWRTPKAGSKKSGPAHARPPRDCMQPELGILEMGYDAGQVLGLSRQLGNSLAGFAHCL